jgi:hypothetical protein
MPHNKFRDSELEVQADEIIERFPFEKVHKHMTSVNHKWIMGDSMVVPTVSQIRIQARVLLTNAIYHQDHCVNIGTGGLVAYKMTWGLQLTFQLAWA